MSMGYYYYYYYYYYYFLIIVSDALQSERQLKGSVKELNMFHNYETEKITHKASDTAENMQLYRVIWFFCPRSSCTTHLIIFAERPPIYAWCTMISGRTTEQHVIIGFGELAAVN